MEVSTRKPKKKRRLIVIVCIILTIFVPFGATRFSENTMFIPFSFRVFRINSEKVDTIMIQSGSTGKVVEYSNRDDIDELTDYLNSFHYIFWIPGLPGERSGWRYRIMLYHDGEYIDYYFNMASIHVRGVWYFNLNLGHYFTRLIDMVK